MASKLFGHKAVEAWVQRWPGTVILLDLSIHLRGDHSPQVRLIVGLAGFIAELAWYDIRHEHGCGTCR